MRKCDVCIGGDYDFENVYIVTTRKARKQHKCYECNGEIQPKEQYHREVCIDGEVVVYKVCAACYEIRLTYSCGHSFHIGTLWEDLEECFPVFRMAGECWDKLSATAKAKLLDKWRKWKGL